MELIGAVKSEISGHKVELTFHKAFDQVNNVVKSYEELSNLGVNRVLTQGGDQPILKNL